MADDNKNVVSVNKGAATASNSNKFTMYIILGLIILLITVMVMATVLIFTFSKMKAPKQIVIRENGNTNYTSTQVQNSGSAEEFGLLVPLNEIIVNLASDSGDEHYLKVNITLEVVNNEKVKEEVAKRVPQFRDMVISILRSKTKDEIDKKEGKENLGGEILNSISSSIGGGKVRHVFFEDFMIQ